MGFSDLLSSGKGPGVIGTLLALLVLVGFGSLYLFVSDAGLQGGAKRIEATIRDQGNEIESLKRMAIERRKKIEEGQALLKQADDIKQWEMRSQAAAKELAEAQEAKGRAEQAVADAQADFEKYKQAYRDSEWAAAKGEDLGDLKTQTGTIHKRAKLRQVTPKGIDITDENGPRSLAYEILPPELQDRFQFDEKQKTEAVIIDIQREDGHIKDVAYAEKTKLFNEKAIKIAELKADSKKAADEINEAQREVPGMEVKVANQRAAIDEEKKKKFSKAPQMQAVLNQMLDKLGETKRSIPSNKSRISNNENKIRTLEAENAQLKKDIAKIVADYQAKQAAGAATAEP